MILIYHRLIVFRNKHADVLNLHFHTGWLMTMSSKCPYRTNWKSSQNIRQSEHIFLRLVIFSSFKPVDIAAQRLYYCVQMVEAALRKLWPQWWQKMQSMLAIQPRFLLFLLLIHPYYIFRLLSSEFFKHKFLPSVEIFKKTNLELRYNNNVRFNLRNNIL